MQAREKLRRVVVRRAQTSPEHEGRNMLPGIREALEDRSRGLLVIL
jgi:hypothetical protein